MHEKTYIRLVKHEKRAKIFLKMRGKVLEFYLTQYIANIDSKFILDLFFSEKIREEEVSFREKL